MQDHGATTITVSRRISADPTGTALLLAGPAALDLWPGVRRVTEVDGRLLVEADLSAATGAADAAPAAARVRARPPQRTPTAFVTRFEWVGAGLPGTTGELTLSYAPGDRAPSTRAEFTLHCENVVGSRLSAEALTAMASGFLDNLAHAAELRSQAA